MNRFYYNLPILLLLLFTSAAQSATYFIDYVGGADANNGTSTNTPWKTHPYMVNSAVSGYSHAAGDRFIFKGGVTWPINTTGAVKPHAGGTVASPDYNGVTNNWYAGTGWNPPRFDGGDVDTEGFDLSYSGGQANLVIDGIDFTNWFLEAIIGANTSAVTNLAVVNCRLENWNTNGAAIDRGIFLLGYGTPPVQGIMSNCFVNGVSTANPNYGQTGYNFGGLIINNIITNMGSAFDGVAGGKVSGNNIGNIGPAWDTSNVHPNAIHVAGVLMIDHNIISNVRGAVILGGTGSSAVIADNLFYDTGSGATFIYSDLAAQFKCYNNTLVATYANAFNMQSGDVVANNHIIDGSIAGSPIQYNNLIESATVATAAGYTVANNWQPATVSAPTVGAGTNLYSAGVTSDLLQMPRPMTGAFDIGAYQYQTGTNGAAGPLIFTATGVSVQNIYQ